MGEIVVHEVERLEHLYHASNHTVAVETRIPRIATTIINSIMVNPSGHRRRGYRCIVKAVETREELRFYIDPT